jgi:hypothetical protein
VAERQNVDHKGGRQSGGNQGASEIQLCVLVRFTAFWRGMVRSGTERWGSTVLQERDRVSREERVWSRNGLEALMVQIGPDRSGSGGWNLDQSGVLNGLIWTNLDLRPAPVTSVLIGAVTFRELSPPGGAGFEA